MEQVLQGVPDCICYIDDVLVTGKSDDEHLQHIGEVFERFDKFGLRVKKAKCFFLKPSVEYLGYKGCCSATGIRVKLYDLSFGMYFFYTWCTREWCNRFGRTQICRDSRVNHKYVSQYLSYA